MRLGLSQAVGYAADIAPTLFTGPRLEILIMKAGLAQFQPPPRSGVQRYGKDELVVSTVQRATVAAGQGDAEAADGLKEFVRLVADQATEDLLEDLAEATRGAGFDLRLVDDTMRLLPLDEPASPLSDRITALEADLDRLGLATAHRHYRQAVDSLIDGRAEASNSQMRAMLEEVVVHVAVAHGFDRTRQGDGGRAIDYMIRSGLLALDDGGEYVRGLWAIIHTNGPHPGTSPAGEAHFRVQAITSAARYLIDRYFPVTE
jgi:hypothetical protein